MAEALPGDAPRLSTLTPEQVEQLRLARGRSKRIQRAIGVATFDAWSVAVFAGLSILCGLFDLSGLLLGLGMGVVALVEFRAIGELRRLNADATRRLGFNQLGFAGIFIIYALWSMYTTATGPGPFTSVAEQGGAEVAAMMKPYEGLARTLAMAMYGGLIVVAVVVQGGTALYHFTRRKHVKAYVEETPGWILDLQRAGVRV